jgi:hypothetical protein
MKNNASPSNPGVVVRNPEGELRLGLLAVVTIPLNQPEK